MDAVFKLLHVEVARKVTGGKEKKKYIVGEICGSFTVCKTEEK